MNNRIFIVAMILSAFLITGCDFHSLPSPENIKKNTQVSSAIDNEPILSRQDVFQKMPCFGCHDSALLFNAVPGKFPHPKHLSLDVHCNQCHEPHENTKARINTAICQGCHSLKPIKYEGGGMGAVVFSHDKHTKKFKCASCHPSIFVMKKGTKKLTMDDMNNGKTCGVCHNGKKAFPSTDCARCHKMG